jgi:ABC-2 type transport system permease protein
MHPVVFQAALRDLLRARRIAVWMLVIVGLFAIAILWTSLGPTGSQRQAYGQLSSILVMRVLALAAAIFATSVLAAEVEQKTIVYLLTRPIPRWKILVSRTAAAVLVTFLIGALGAVAVSLAIYRGGFLANPLLGSDLAMLAIGACAYGTLFVLASLFINRSMIVALIYAFGWETLIPNISGDLYFLSIYSYLSTIAAHPTLGGGNMLGALSGQLGTNVMSKNTAWSALTVLVVVCISLGAYWFSTHAYLPREDSE